MKALGKHTLFPAAILLFALASAFSAFAQTNDFSAFAQTSVAPSTVLGNPVVWLVVADAEKAIAFYRDTLGLEFARDLYGLNLDGTIPSAAGANAGLEALGDTPGAKYRNATLRAPGSLLKIEFHEYQNIDRKPMRHPRVQDPGSAALIILVRDIDNVIAKLKAADTPIVDAAEIAPASAGRTIFVQDPDGFFVGISQRTPLPRNVPATGNVIGAELQYAGADKQKILRIYRDILGFEFSADNALDPKVLRARIPGNFGLVDGAGTPRNVSFIVPKDGNRQPPITRIQDPGTASLTLMVRDLNATAKALQGAGVELITKNRAASRVGATPFLMLHDPNTNLLLELLQPVFLTQPR
jgi:catechol 2,3-dioxygenase-like lactoylglutathione lyase family enzyme